LKTHTAYWASEKDEDTYNWLEGALTTCILQPSRRNQAAMYRQQRTYGVAQWTTLLTDRGGYVTYAAVPLSANMMLRTTKTSPAGNSADRHRSLRCAKLAEGTVAVWVSGVARTRRVGESKTGPPPICNKMRGGGGGGVVGAQRGTYGGSMIWDKVFIRALLGAPFLCGGRYCVADCYVLHDNLLCGTGRPCVSKKKMERSGAEWKYALKNNSRLVG